MVDIYLESQSILRLTDSVYRELLCNNIVYVYCTNKQTKIDTFRQLDSFYIENILSSKFPFTVRAKKMKLSQNVPPWIVQPLKRTILKIKVKVSLNLSSQSLIQSQALMVARKLKQYKFQIVYSKSKPILKHCNVVKGWPGTQWS